MAAQVADERTPELITAGVAAKMMGTTPFTVYRLMERRKLPKVQIGRSVRTTREAVTAFIREHTTPAEG